MVVLLKVSQARGQDRYWEDRRKGENLNVGKRGSRAAFFFHHAWPA
jgi:hypothetical protein